MVTFTRRRLFFVFVFLWTAAIALAGLGSEATSALNGLAGGTPTATATGSPACSPTGTPYTLYNQNDNPAPTPGGIISQAFVGLSDAYSSVAADDFVVPEGQTWYVSQVVVVGEYNVNGFPAPSFDVLFYVDANTLLPSGAIQGRYQSAYVDAEGTSTITLSSPVVLSPGTYWVSIQSEPSELAHAQWFWDNRAVVSNSGAAWKNPGGGFHTGCGAWTRKTTCVPTTNGPDQLFELIGTAGGVCGTPTPTPTYTATPSPFPSCTPGWFPRADLNPPMGAARSVGISFPRDYHFYVMGGQSSDSPGNNFMHPFEYGSPSGWITKAATFPDADVNDMACGILTVSGSAKIYCVGGSAGGGTTATARVFSYDPTIDVLTSLAGSDDWPGNPPSSGNILPGGFAVLNNKLYTIGAFQIESAHDARRCMGV